MTQVRDDDGIMWRAVHLREGSLVVEGHDLGDGVERVLGCREYEFTRTLSAAGTSTLREQLGLVPDADLLTAIERRFPSTHEFELFLTGHGIPGEFWSRRGS